jgi:uncharacterized protein YggU (UPF0235/DUF167 family)
MPKELHIKLTPKASSNRVVVESSTEEILYLKVYVTAIPENGKANEAMIALLAKHFKIPKTAFELVHGHKSRNKILLCHI